MGIKGTLPGSGPNQAQQTIIGNCVHADKAAVVVDAGVGDVAGGVELGDVVDGTAQASDATTGTGTVTGAQTDVDAGLRWIN